VSRGVIIFRRRGTGGIMKKAAASGSAPDFIAVLVCIPQNAIINHVTRNAGYGLEFLRRP